MKYLLLVFMLVGCGQVGSPGLQGSPGIAGPKGDPGLNAIAPSVTTTPATSEECANGGTDIFVNEQATTICNGMQGQTGQDATPVTFVQFCTGVTPTYPSNFPEVGICVDGQLYGVYSANGGFLSLLTPGQYNSNGINASCTFTVQPNCQVSQ